ncbi:hypothetical protein [Streptomyces qinzhouensis]|uniref:hypothetical protein n=1 Tax=Streptomyces qinzhouensis TaxID=2599401 RepID=UPI001FE29E72|nr:hypothetical protein [Streptomyces qinzhouensis]
MPEDIHVGGLAYDTVNKCIGVVMDTYGGRIALRPPAGGCEWDVRREDVRPATVFDRIRAELADVNAQSSKGMP